MIILFLKYYSVQKTHDGVEKKKEVPVKKKTVEKVIVQDPAVEAVHPVPEPHLGESLGWEIIRVSNLHSLIIAFPIAKFVYQFPFPLSLLYYTCFQWRSIIDFRPASYIHTDRPSLAADGFSIFFFSASLLSLSFIIFSSPLYSINLNEFGNPNSLSRYPQDTYHLPTLVQCRTRKENIDRVDEKVIIS